MQQSTLEAAPLLPEGEELFGDDDFGDPADETRVPGEDPNVSG